MADKLLNSVMGLSSLKDLLNLNNNEKTRPDDLTNPWVMHKYALCLFTSGGALFNQANVRCIAHAGYFDTLRRYKKTIKI